MRLFVALTAAILISYPALPLAAEISPVQIVVSLNEQHLKAFRGTETIAESNISSGKSGYSTPTGIFSILDKKERHFSNQYDDAPMPFMQRLTWTGIALHGSHSVPRYPASHGCVRMPFGFDEELFGLTRIGGHVIITGDMVEPSPVTHTVLPQPRNAHRAPPDQWRLRMQLGAERPFATLISTADMLAPVRDFSALRADPGENADNDPLRIFITRRSRFEIATDIQRVLNRLGYDAGVEDGHFGPASRRAIKRFEAVSGLRETGVVTPELVTALYKAVGESAPRNAKLLVRRDFEPLFETAISIADPSRPLGAHLLVATRFDAEAGSVQWNGFTLENLLSARNRAIYGIDPKAPAGQNLVDTLDRIAMPEELRLRLGEILTPGSSIVIADNGADRYTGWKTDFIINTQIDRKGRKAARKKYRSKPRDRAALAARQDRNARAAPAQVKRRPARCFSLTGPFRSGGIPCPDA